MRTAEEPNLNCWLKLNWHLLVVLRVLLALVILRGLRVILRRIALRIAVGIVAGLRLLLAIVLRVVHLLVALVVSAAILGHLLHEFENWAPNMCVSQVMPKLSSAKR